jgi:hypothetical protein
MTPNCRCDPRHNRGRAIPFQIVMLILPLKEKQLVVVSWGCYYFLGFYHCETFRLVGTAWQSKTLREKPPFKSPFDSLPLYGTKSLCESGKVIPFVRLSPVLVHSRCRMISNNTGEIQRDLFCHSCEWP